MKSGGIRKMAHIEEISKMNDRVSNEVLKEIFPKKLSRFQSSEQVYVQLKRMILSGKFKKGQRLLQEKIYSLGCLAS